MTTVTHLGPGIHDHVPADAYHADPCPEPSLSSSIVKTIVLASALHAHHDHPRLNPAAVDEDSEAMDIGTAAHALFLEGAASIAVIEAKDFRTNAAKEARDAARLAGKIPLLAKSWAAVQAMVAAIRAQLDCHTDGGADMFTDGKAEQTLIWREDGDVWCRARLDWLRPSNIDDLKTTSASANPDTWTRTIFFAGVDIQAAWYLRGLRAITGEDATFRFCVVETFEPYALSVVGLGPDALVLSEKKILYALDVWRACRKSDSWPGYAERTAWASLPMAHEAWWLEKESR